MWQFKGCSPKTFRACFCVCVCVCVPSPLVVYSWELMHGYVFCLHVATMYNIPRTGEDPSRITLELCSAHLITCVGIGIPFSTDVQLCICVLCGIKRLYQ